MSGHSGGIDWRRRVADVLRHPLRWVLVVLVRGYQLLISPLLGPTCRYYPSCSHYAIQALETHGVIRGSWLAIRRLLRCHPWSPGGVDHVPPARSKAAERTATEQGV